MEAKETQPPEMPMRPQVHQDGPVQQRIEDADEKGKRSRQQNLFGQVTRRQVAHGDQHHGINHKRQESGYLIFAEGHHGHDEYQGGEQFHPGVQPVERRLLVGEGLQVADVE